MTSCGASRTSHIDVPFPLGSNKAACKFNQVLECILYVMVLSLIIAPFLVAFVLAGELRSRLPEEVLHQASLTEKYSK